MITIKTSMWTVTIELNGNGSGALNSSWHDASGRFEGESLYDTAIDAVESLVLAHACAGIDVTAPAYVAGLETTIETIVNYLAE